MLRFLQIVGFITQAFKVMLFWPFMIAQHFYTLGNELNKGSFERRGADVMIQIMLYVQIIYLFMVPSLFYNYIVL